MRTSILALAAPLAMLTGCGDDPAPTPPADVVIVYDIQAIDRPGDAPPPPQDRPATDVATDRGPERCQMGSFVPCECAPTITGTRRCLSTGMLETTCRCDGFDAGPDDAASADGAVNDLGADGATTDTPASDSAGGPSDASATDASAADDASAG